MNLTKRLIKEIKKIHELISEPASYFMPILREL